VLETDCPYLAPVPHRGKRNEPAYIPLIAQRVAELKKITLEELSYITVSNSKKLFNDSYELSDY
jgi:TatD DNase family protein